MEAMPESETAEPAAVSTTCGSVALPPRSASKESTRGCGASELSESTTKDNAITVSERLLVEVA